jgi:hypothetical protein
MSKIPRTFVGDIGGGEMIVRCSASGFDALTASDDGHKITFDSRWVNISKPTAIGVAGESIINTITGSDFYGLAASFPDLGFKPFVEVRLLQGNVCFDDYFNASFPSGAYGNISTGSIVLLQSGNPGAPLGRQMLYIVYSVPVPSN